MSNYKTCTIRILDEVNVVVIGLHPDHLGYFYEHYSIFAPNYFFNPKFKLGVWDGRISYFHKTGKTYLNLLDDIIPRIVGLGYKIKIDDLRKTIPVNPELIDANFFANRGILDPNTGEPWVMRPYQVDLINTLTESGGGVGIAGTGAGKAQPLNSKILTPSGWITMGEAKIGDVVITPCGETSNIIGIFPQGIKDVYEITFHDGSQTRCELDHLWKVNFPKQLHKAWTEPRIVSTSDIIKFLERKKTGTYTPGNISIPLIQPIDSVEQDLPLDPYLLGVLIGDGCLSQTVMITSKDDEILSSVSRLIQPLKLHLSHYANYDYAIVKNEKPNSVPPSPNILKEMLKNLKLYGKVSNSKFIPEIYKNGSKDQRFSIIRGLMDTDGTSNKKGDISFTTVSKVLSTDVQELVWSLGGTCTISSRVPTFTYLGEKKQGQLAYTCFIGHPFPKLFFSLQRKKDRCRENHADCRIKLARRVTSVNLVSKELTQCIMIDHPEHLYITDNYIVTHNTSVTAALALIYEDAASFRSIIIVPDKNLTDQTHREYQFFGVDVGEYSGDRKDLKHQHIVSTWQALKNNPKVIQSVDMVIVDECLDKNVQITMADQTLKYIKDVEPDDVVMTYNEITTKYEPNRVIKRHENLSVSSTEQMYLLEFDNGITLEVTGNHKILTTSGYIRADELTPVHEIINLV